MAMDLKGHGPKTTHQRRSCFASKKYLSLGNLGFFAAARESVQAPAATISTTDAAATARGFHTAMAFGKCRLEALPLHLHALQSSAIELCATGKCHGSTQLQDMPQSLFVLFALETVIVASPAKLGA
jgi:hypothetical protein